jgi:transposase
MDKTKTARRKYAPSAASPRGGARRRTGAWAHPYEVRLKAVKLRLEEGFSVKLIAHELGVARYAIYEWIKRYRQLGETGLKPRLTRVSSRRNKLPVAVKARIVELKEQHPSFGVKKISQWLRRVLMLPGSAETVRKTLHRERLIPRQRGRKGSDRVLLLTPSQERGQTEFCC